MLEITTVKAEVLIIHDIHSSDVSHFHTAGSCCLNTDTLIYYIPINDTAFDFYVFWPSDTECPIELRFSESVSQSL